MPRVLPVILLLFGATAAAGCVSSSAANDPPPPRASLEEIPFPAAEVLQSALSAARCDARRRGREFTPADMLTVIDYSLDSTERRLWVLGGEGTQVLFWELVAHGRNTGENRATSFSDVEGSKQSSLGLFRTAEIYRGKHGYSLRLDGLEPGWNGHARERAIVLHGADYVSAEFVRTNGRLGRSWGCPAVGTDVSEQLIDTIAEGSLIFAWYPDARWQETSTYLECAW